MHFSGHMLVESARMSIEDGLVMQLHAGAYRNHNTTIFERFGPDQGADIPVRGEFTRNLRPLLNKFGNDPRLTLVLFTLDETTYSRELAPLAGHYPAVRIGPPWWFFDSIEGMTRFRSSVTETAGIYNTAGFNDDTRAFCSIPARHDLSRRVDSSFLAGLVAIFGRFEEDQHVNDATGAAEYAGPKRTAHRLLNELPHKSGQHPAIESVLASHRPQGELESAELRTPLVEQFGVWASVHLNEPIPVVAIFLRFLL